MRMRRWVVVGALAASAGAGACADALAPDAAAVGRDLDVFVPSVLVSPEGAPVDEVGALRPVRVTEGTAPISELKRAFADLSGFETVNPETAPTDETAALPIIASSFLTMSINGTRLVVEYGFFGGGWGYEMGFGGAVWGAEGNLLRPLDQSSRAEHVPIWWYMRPTRKEEFHIPAPCGATAEGVAKFTVYNGFPGVRAMQVQDSRRAHAQQAVCEPPSSGSGAPDPTPFQTNDGLQICYYEVWVDGNGAVVDVFLVRCESLGGGGIPWAESRSSLARRAP